MEGEIEEMQPAADVAPVGGAPGGAVEEVDEEIGASDEPVDPPPPSPPAHAVEVVSGAAVDEHRVAVPAPAAAARWWYQDRLKRGLLILTAGILGGLFIYNMGGNPLAWWGELAGMTYAEWLTAFFLAVGDIASLGLIFSPSPYFLAMWTDEGGAAAGLPVLVPPLAGAVNCGVWLAYGIVVEGMNASVIIINLIGVLFNLGYSTIFLLRSSTRRICKLAVIFIAVAMTVAVAIAAVDYCILVKTWGWQVPEAVGRSGAFTGSLMYSFVAYVTMRAVKENRGAGGLPAQAVASFGNAFVWFVYACVQKDKSMQICNGIGMGCFLLQAVQLAFFWLTKPREEEGTQRRKCNSTTMRISPAYLRRPNAL